MKQFSIKITFEENGQHIAEIDFSGKEGELLGAPVLDVNLKRKRVECLAAIESILLADRAVHIDLVVRDAAGQKPSVLGQDVSPDRLCLDYPVCDLVSGLDVFLEELDNDDPDDNHGGYQHYNLIDSGRALEYELIFFCRFHTVPPFRTLR